MAWDSGSPQPLLLVILRTGKQLPHVLFSRHYFLVHKRQGRGCSSVFEPAGLDMHWRLIMQRGEAGSPCRSSNWLDIQTWRSQVGSPKLTLEPYKWDQSCWKTCMVLGLILAKGEEGRNLGSLEPSLAQITDYYKRRKPFLFPLS